jgi:hypothetical protein
MPGQESSTTYETGPMIGMLYRGKNLDDPRLINLINWGMPADAERVRLVCRGSQFGQEFEDFTVELFGVIGAEQRGATGGVVFCSSDEEELSMHVWLRRVRLKGARTAYEEMWHKELGWQDMINYIHGDPVGSRQQIVKRLADGMMLGFLAQEKLSEERRGGYTLKQIREMTAEAVENYAREQTAGGGQPEKFKKTSLARHWRYKIIANNLYKLIRGKEEWGSVEDDYDRRCRELRNAESV